MIKYLSSRNVNIFTKNNSRLMKIAIVSPYKQYSKKFKNGGLLCKYIYFENNFYNNNISMWYSLSITDVPCSAFSTVNSALNMASGAFSIPTKYFIYRLIMSDYFHKFATDQIIRITSLKLNVFLLKTKRFLFENIFNSLNSITFVDYLRAQLQCFH